MTRHSEAFKALEETAAYVPPSYPPPADERAETQRYLPAVPVFFGQRCTHSADRPLPATSQHAATEACEALERTIDVGPASGVRAAVSGGSCERPTPDARAAGGGSALSVGGSVLVGGAR